MLSQRMLDGQIKPTAVEMAKTVGEKSFLWAALQKYLAENYDLIPETVFYGKKYGWTIRYRKSGKTLCSLFPEENAFTVLVVLGGKELENAFSLLDKLSPEVPSVFQNAKQLGDGRWLWIQVSTNDDLESIKALLNAKRKPKNRSIEREKYHA